MIVIVTREETSARLVTAVFKSQLVTCTWKHDGSVEVDQVRIGVRISLREADSVRVMTGTAWHVVVTDVQPVLGKALVVEDAGAIVARITQRIRAGALGRSVLGLVVSIQQ